MPSEEKCYALISRVVEAKVEAHGDGKRIIVKADHLLTAFLSLERDAIAITGATGNATRPNVA